MNDTQRKVTDFHRVMGQTVGTTPAIRDAELRASLILEEAVETVAAIVGTRRALEMIEGVHRQVQDDLGHPSNPGRPPDLAEAADGLCDLDYVLNGTAVAFGIDLEPLFDEVHRTNMAKASGPVRADGKRLKPEGWQPPRIAEMLAAQGEIDTGAPEQAATEQCGECEGEGSWVDPSHGADRICQTCQGSGESSVTVKTKEKPCLSLSLSRRDPPGDRSVSDSLRALVSTRPIVLLRSVVERAEVAAEEILLGHLAEPKVGECTRGRGCIAYRITKAIEEGE